MRVREAALELGVKGIEHGQFISEETVQLMKEKGAFISPYVASVPRMYGDYNALPEE